MGDDLLDLWMEDHINGGYGEVLDELAAHEWAELHEGFDEPHHLDEPWDDLLERQEKEDFEQTDEYFGFYGDEEF